MTGNSHLTSAGHALSEGSWLDAHFASARPEYEDSLRHVGIQPGWTVLDAGCGNGGFLPLMAELVGSKGGIVAMDFAPENVASVEDIVREGRYSTNVRAEVGSITSLPFDNASFDCVWSANVIQYLTEAEFGKAVSELQRVLKPGGVLAIKEFDSALMNLQPLDADYIGAIWAARRAKAAQTKRLGAWSGTSVPSRLRQAGLEHIWRKGWLVERWGPVPSETQAFVRAVMKEFASDAPNLPVASADLLFWDKLDERLVELFDDPDFCFREFFVLTVARIAK